MTDASRQQVETGQAKPLRDVLRVHVDGDQESRVLLDEELAILDAEPHPGVLSGLVEESQHFPVPLSWRCSVSLSLQGPVRGDVASAHREPLRTLLLRHRLGEHQARVVNDEHAVCDHEFDSEALSGGVEDSHLHFPFPFRCISIIAKTRRGVNTLRVFVWEPNARSKPSWLRLRYLHKSHTASISCRRTLPRIPNMYRSRFRSPSDTSRPSETRVLPQGHPCGLIVPSVVLNDLESSLIRRDVGAANLLFAVVAVLDEPRGGRVGGCHVSR